MLPAVLYNDFAVIIYELIAIVILGLVIRTLHLQKKEAGDLEERRRKSDRDTQLKGRLRNRDRR